VICYLHFGVVYNVRVRSIVQCLRLFLPLKYIVLMKCLKLLFFLFCFCTYMSGAEGEEQRRIREARMRKGKQATTASHRKERQEKNLYVPKTRKRRDARLGGEC